MILVNGIAENRIDISNRGLQYGDGVFETIAYRNGQYEFLTEHLSRLVMGCERLGIPFTDLDSLKSDLSQIKVSLDSNTIIKIIVTRGAGGRGYLADVSAKPDRIVSTHPFPEYPSEIYDKGIKLRVCHHRLSTNSRLAGIKHLNRLDQVIARNEWTDSTISEGLTLDQVGHVIEGTMSNLFLVKDKTLFTPSISESGIRGIIRDKLIELAVIAGLRVLETTITLDDVFHADEVFVCNSIIGLWPVRDCDGHIYQIGPTTRALSELLQTCPK